MNPGDGLTAAREAKDWFGFGFAFGWALANGDVAGTCGDLGEKVRQAFDAETSKLSEVEALTAARLGRDMGEDAVLERKAGLSNPAWREKTINDVNAIIRDLHGKKSHG